MEFGPFWVGDEPANPLAIDLYSTEDLSAYTSATGTLYAPDGTAVPFGTVPIEDERVVFPWPVGVLTQEGLHTLHVTLTGGGYKLALDPIYTVVQAEDGWHTLASAREQWTTDLSDPALYELLDVAKAQCVAYAPVVESVPPNHRRAQIVQARNLHNAQAANPASGDFGETFSLSTRPLDWHVKNLLRPSRGRPLVG